MNGARIHDLPLQRGSIQIIVAFIIGADVQKLPGAHGLGHVQKQRLHLCCLGYPVVIFIYIIRCERTAGRQQIDIRPRSGNNFCPKLR